MTDICLTVFERLFCRRDSFAISDGVGACLCVSLRSVCMCAWIYVSIVWPCVLCVSAFVCVRAHMCVQCSAPAVSSDVVTPLLVSCCVSRGVLRSWMLSQYRCWGWWASGTDNSLIAHWWTAGKLFPLLSFPHPPLNAMTTCCKWSSEVCVCVCTYTYDCRIRWGWALFDSTL